MSGGGKACWAAGGAEPTIADFVLYDVVEQSRMLAGGILAAGGLKCVHTCVCVYLRLCVAGWLAGRLVQHNRMPSK